MTTPHLPRLTRFSEELYGPLITIAADEFSVKPEDVLHTRRIRRASSARFVTMSLMRVFFDVSLDEIGYVFGMAHTSVIHGSTRVEQDPDLREAATRIGKKFAAYLTKEGLLG